MSSISTKQGRYYHPHFKEIEAERFHLSNRIRIKTQVSLTQKRMPLSQYYLTFQINRERRERMEKRIQETILYSSFSKI